jgi:hypothetical protein
MSASEIRTANEISSLLDMSRSGVATAFVMGEPLHPDIRNALLEVHRMLEKHPKLLEKISKILEKDKKEQEKHKNMVNDYKNAHHSKKHDERQKEFKAYKKWDEDLKSGNIEHESVTHHTRAWMQAMKKVIKNQEQRKKYLERKASKTLAEKTELKEVVEGIAENKETLAHATVAPHAPHDG